MNNFFYYYFTNALRVVKIIFAVFLSLIPYLGGAILIYRGVVNLNKKTRKLYKTEQQATYVQDRRYRSGTRFAGNTNVEVVVGEIEDVRYRKKCVVKGVIYLLIAVVSIAYYTYSIYNK